MNAGPLTQNRIWLGIGFMLLAASLFPVMNGLVQWLSQRYPTEQVVWARITGHLIAMVAVMLPARGLLVMATRRPWAQAGRSLCQFGSTSCYFTGIVTLPLAKAASIGFLAPFVVALLAWPMLGEKPKALRLAMVAVAFCGVLVVIRPGMDWYEPATLFILGSVAFYAMYQVLTRKVAPHDKAETSALWSALLGAVVSTALVPFVWVAPQSFADVLAFLALGALGAAGHYCVARAMSYGAAAVISPFQYWQIVGSVLMGVAVTGLWPDGATWLGAAIIIGAGIALALMEARRGKGHT